MADSWPRRVSKAAAAFTASGRVLSLVPEMFKRRRRDPDTVVPWDSERLVTDGDQWYDQQLAEIARARKWVEYEVYIFECDPLGRRVEEALAAAAARRVDVRLLVDGIGSATWVRTRARELIAAGVEVRVYHPPPWAILPFRWTRKLGWGDIVKPLRWWNNRNHRKVCLIDRRIAWVGSFNVDGRHLRTLSGDAAWRDTGARVEGHGVRILERAFERSWRVSWMLTRSRARPSFDLGTRRLHVPVGHLVRLNHGLRLRRRWRHDLCQRIGTAQRRVWISSAYFVPDRQLMYSLSLAAVSGADVRLLVPKRSDVWFMPLIARAFYDRLVRSGVKVHEYEPSMLHAKTVIVDDWCSVGSTNLNYRSFLHDLEADVVLTRAETRRELAESFLRDLERSSELTPATWVDHSWWQRWLGRFMLSAKHWM